MKALLYEVTSFKHPRFVEGYGERYKKGYAYQTESHFIHFWSYERGVTLQTNIPITEQRKEGINLESWVKSNFGAINLKYTSIDIGDSIDSVWRPSLFYDSEVFAALNTSLAERNLTESSLRVLLEKLDDLFLYIEPDPKSFNVYSHKIRELLILACTEVETFWTFYLHKAGEPETKRFTTNDYFKLKDKLFLEEYTFTLKSFSSIPTIRPFANWNGSKPTESLKWYNAYNKTKHNRNLNFSYATFENAINSVVANLVLYSVRFGPHSMITSHGVFNTLVNQHFKFGSENVNLEFMYVPLVKHGVAELGTEFDLYNAEKKLIYEPYKVLPFSI